MEFDYTSFQSMLAAQASANWGFWTMMAAFLSALASIATAIIAFQASKAWRKQERLAQLVRLKRAAFEYRALLERIGSSSNEVMSRDEYIVKILVPARADIFHELVLAGLDNAELEQSKLFEELFSLQERFKESQVRFGELLNAAVNFQKSVIIKL